MLRDSRVTIDNVAKAKAWLIKEEFLIEGENMSPAALSQALMRLAAGDQCTVEQLVDGIRAVGLCLKEWDREEAVEETLKASTTVLLEETRKEIKRIADEVASEVKASMSHIEGRAGGRSWADEADAEEFQRNAIQDIAKAIPTYAQVLANEWRKDVDKKEDRKHQDYLAKESLRRRRVLIDGLDGLQSAVGGLTPKEIVEKANLALEAARARTDGNGTELESKPLAVAARVLENGGGGYRTGFGGNGGLGQTRRC